MSKRTPIRAESEAPGVSELFEAIASLLPDASGFDGVIVRSVGTKYANENDFFSGVGAARTGGRWNRPGLEAVYASLDVLTATQEAYQNLLTFGFPLTTILPRVTAGARVTLGKVLDLTNRSIPLRIGFSASDLVGEDWRGIQSGGEESWTQAIGRGAHRAGFEALIAPSAQNANGKNIVIFPQKLGARSRIKILGADQLP